MTKVETDGTELPETEIKNGTLRTCEVLIGLSDGKLIVEGLSPSWEGECYAAFEGMQLKLSKKEPAGETGWVRTVVQNGCAHVVVHDKELRSRFGLPVEDESVVPDAGTTVKVSLTETGAFLVEELPDEFDGTAYAFKDDWGTPCISKDKRSA
jgi:hypothetical protein